MNTLYDQLIELLKQDPRLWAEDQLLKNQVIELGLKLDPALLKLLLSHDRLKARFFVDVDGVMVFDKEKFIRFVNNKAFLPDSYTSFKNKIGLTVNGHYLSESRDVVLAWPYKDCVLEGGQTKEDQKRDEVFWNEILAPDEIDRLLAPKVLTGFKRYDASVIASEAKQSPEGGEIASAEKLPRNDSAVIEIQDTDNLIIKGNNLLALHSLKKRFAGKVKLIYIDPPFNTDDDSFQYNDSFTQSTWFTFLKNRLEIARYLMAKDASIFVHIDQDNKHPVKMILDDVFGGENFRNEIILPGRAAKNLQQQFDAIKKLQVRHDTLFWYSKNPETNFPQYWIEKHDVGNIEGHWHHAWSTAERKTMQYELLGTNIDKGQWVWSEERALKAVDNYNRFLEEGGGRTLVEYWRDTAKKLSFIRVSPDDGRPQYWRSPADSRLGDTVWVGVPIYSSNHNFKTEKNEKFLAEILNLASKEGDIVLDFFSGSGTTAATAHKLNRRWIAIEQMDYIETITLKRLEEVVGRKTKIDGRLIDDIDCDNTGISKDVKWQGGGSFVYCELMPWNETFIQQIQTAQDKNALQIIWAEMQEKAFLSHRLNAAKFDANAEDFAGLSLDDQKRFLLEVLDKNQLYVNFSEIDDETYGVSEADKRLNRLFYG